MQTVMRQVYCRPRKPVQRSTFLVDYNGDFAWVAQHFGDQHGAKVILLETDKQRETISAMAAKLEEASS